jgi:hypothetical protein
MVGVAEQYDGVVVVVENGSVVVEVGDLVVSEDDDIVEETVVTTADVLDLNVVGLLDAGFDVVCTAVVVLVAAGDVVDGVLMELEDCLELERLLDCCWIVLVAVLDGC